MTQSLQTSTKANKRFYWLKLNKDFFNRDDIRIIKSMPNGKDYIIFYLELMLKSINDDGKLIFKDTIPYTPEMLASITQTSIDTVRVAIDAFVKLGLIDILDDGGFFMQEVQKLVGSETADAERKRKERSGKNTSVKLVSKDKQRTLSVNCPENVTLENKRIELKENPPYTKDNLQASSSSGIMDIWLGQIKQVGHSFFDTELAAIGEWAQYKTDNGKTVSIKQVTLTLEILTEHKSSGYDIVRMIKRSIASGYAGIMTPTKDYLLPGHKLPEISGKYPAAEYIIPETSTQKIELRNYLERCYMRDKVDPRTQKPLNKEQLNLFRQHYQQSKLMHLSIPDYISRFEVMSGICLLDQPIEPNSIAVH